MKPDGTVSGVNRQILLVEAPKGKLAESNFKLSDGTVPVPNDGEVLLRVKLLSLDAANRAWMQGATYRAAVEAGTVMAGGAIAEVVTSKASGLTAGDLVFADTGIGDAASAEIQMLQAGERSDCLYEPRGPNRT